MGELVRLRPSESVEIPPIACRSPRVEPRPPSDPFFGLLLVALAIGWAAALLLLAFGFMVGGLILKVLRL